MPPQSETARKLMRVLGRGDDDASGAAVTVVYTGFQNNNVGGGVTDGGAVEYGRYVDAYNGYLAAINGVNATAAAQVGGGRCGRKNAGRKKKR